MKKYVYQIIEENGKRKPKIPIRITNPLNGESLRVLALIDTGADVCTMPIMIARTLGINLNKDTKLEKGTRGISDEQMETHVGVLSIHLLDPSKKEVLRSLKSIVNIIDSRIPVILGTNNFLGQFNIGMNHIDDEIVLSW